MPNGKISGGYGATHATKAFDGRLAWLVLYVLAQTSPEYNCILMQSDSKYSLAVQGQNVTLPRS